MALHGIRDAQLCTMFSENPVVFGVAPSAKSVRQNVKVGGYPLSLPLKIVLNLQSGEVARHLEANLMSSPAILEEIKTGGGISLAGDLVAVPPGQEKYIFFISARNWSKNFLRDLRGKFHPPPPPKMSFSSKKGHFKTHDAYFLPKKI